MSRTAVPGAQSLLSVRDLSVSYRTVEHERLALDAVDLDVRAGEIVGLVGQSGSGKSTLAAAVLGLLPDNARTIGGSVTFDEVDLARLGSQELRRIRGQEISIVFQDPTTSLNPRLSVGKQMVQVQRAHASERTTHRSMRDRAVAGLAEVGLPNPERAFNLYPHEFSGGMRQRVMIAMSILLDPKLIIADEATSALDVTLEAQVLELLLRLRETHGASVLFISHNLGVVSQLCDRTTVLHAGRAIEEIDGRVIWARCRHPYTQSLAASAAHKDARIRRLPATVPDLDDAVAGCHFAGQCPHAREVCRTVTPDLYDHEGGSVRCFAYSPTIGSEWPNKPDVADWFGSSTQSGALVDAESEDTSSALVSIKELRVHFGRRDQTVRAVDGVDLTIERGEIVAVVGESGSGKTTLAEALVRLVPLAGGTIAVNGEATAGMSATEVHEFRRRVQMVFQSAQGSLSPRMQVGSLVTEPYKIFRIPKDQRMRLEEILARVGLPPELLNSYPSQLSGGQARRVGLARALVCEPELLVADEPTSGLDAAAAASAASLLGDLRDEYGLAILLITHDLSLVTNLADRIAVMYFGKIVETGPVSEIVRAPAHPYTKALLSLVLDPDESAPVGRRELLAQGEIPSQSAPPSGCRFHPRCQLRQDICSTSEPVLGVVAGGERRAACHFAEQVVRDLPTSGAQVSHGDL